MRILGITGGIGSGKSFVTGIFRRLGVPDYNADNRTKALYRTDIGLKYAIRDAFGPHVLENNEISFPKLAELIFKSSENLQKIEKIVHPHVLEDFRAWCRSQQERGVPYVILESAILLEKDLFRNICDRTLSVEAPLELRIQRVMTRDHASREQVQDRILRQWSDEKRRSLVDFTVLSDGRAPLLPQIEKIHSQMNGKPC